MTTTETPPEEQTPSDPGDKPKRDTSPRRFDKLATKVGIAIVAALAVTALVISFMSGGTPTDRGWTPGAPEPVKPAGWSKPLNVSVPSINASSSLVPVGQEKDGSLTVPPVSKPMQAAWYEKSPTPGQVGPAVVLGHVNGNGKPGIFAKLNDVKPGQEVFVAREDGQTAVFKIDKVDLVPKDKFPTMQVYGDVPNSQIRLITCGGELDRAARSYKSNVVVYGSLERLQKT